MIKYYRVKVHGIKGYELYVSSVRDMFPEDIVDECQRSGLFDNYGDANFANVKEESFNVEHNYISL